MQITQLIQLLRADGVVVALSSSLIVENWNTFSVEYVECSIIIQCAEDSKKSSEIHTLVHHIYRNNLCIFAFCLCLWKWLCLCCCYSLCGWFFFSSLPSIWMSMSSQFFAPVTCALALFRSIASQQRNVFNRVSIIVLNWNHRFQAKRTKKSVNRKKTFFCQVEGAWARRRKIKCKRSKRWEFGRSSRHSELIQTIDSTAVCVCMCFCTVFISLHFWSNSIAHLLCLPFVSIECVFRYLSALLLFDALFDIYKCAPYKSETQWLKCGQEVVFNSLYTHNWHFYQHVFGFSHRLDRNACVCADDLFTLHISTKQIQFCLVFVLDF